MELFKKVSMLFSRIFLVDYKHFEVFFRSTSNDWSTSDLALNKISCVCISQTPNNSFPSPLNPFSSASATVWIGHTNTLSLSHTPWHWHFCPVMTFPSVTIDRTESSNVCKHNLTPKQRTYARTLSLGWTFRSWEMRKSYLSCFQNTMLFFPMLGNVTICNADRSELLSKH